MQQGQWVLAVLIGVALCGCQSQSGPRSQLAATAVALTPDIPFV